MAGGTTKPAHGPTPDPLARIGEGAAASVPLEPEQPSVHGELIAGIERRLDVLRADLDDLHVHVGDAADLDKWTRTLRNVFMELHEERHSEFPVLVLHSVLAAGQRLKRNKNLPSASKARLKAARETLAEELKPRCIGIHDRDLVILVTASLRGQVGSFGKGTLVLDALAGLALLRARSGKTPDVSDEVAGVLQDARAKGLVKNAAPSTLRKQSYRARKKARG